MIKEVRFMRSTRNPGPTEAPEVEGTGEQDFRSDEGAARPLILLVDGEDRQLAPCVACLEQAGFASALVHDGTAALTAIARQSYAVIVADVATPLGDPIGILRAARRRDLDVPLLVVSGTAEAGLANVAVQQGALRRLEKPIVPGKLCDSVAHAFQLYELARLRRSVLDALGGDWRQLGDRVALEQVFERAFGGLSIAFQPIISWSSRRVIGHEALLRSSDARLPNPASVLAVAERLGRVEQIGRLVRERVARSMTKAPAEFVFVNIHPHELLDADLYLATAPLSQVSKRVVLEISEHALLDGIEHLETRAQALRKLGFRLALDNLGPGYPGLSSFARLRPEFVKYDQSLVRGIDAQAIKAEVVAKMTKLLAGMSTKVIASGIESIGERDAVIAAGVDLLQGFAFSRPDTAYRQPELG
jgi:EAL domain-containing protein (putative c-di-GMP-specific phosphodiesterase class I)/CheY-like chemotaxis protein